VYHRYCQPGEDVTLSATLTEVTGPKQTALGEGWFFTTRNTWSVGDEVVAEMDFRILKFRPATQQAAVEAPSYDGLDPTKLIKPTVSRDTAFFWDGVAAHELRIQRLADGSLRHPPIPATWKPWGESTDFQVAAGNGTVFSYVVHHAPKVPGRELPFVVALVELDEGVRMLGQLRGVDPDQVAIGMKVDVEFLDFPADGDDEPWTLYAWKATQ
ncbi:MAG: Zn-ribbon domain-containing OB-fold protein, partial [Gordonia sp. (in: high G+C Gram-positive bacteria)]|uniref:Zn-ribbon domain-containing OB-fold protein n=1 Tax=Gordonia sp. (in: high G+C Gram-positive bacteria) TaxID=84139 RepID=UPI003BB5C221